MGFCAVCGNRFVWDRGLFRKPAAEPEFGTRFALGAQIRDVAWLVIGHAFRLLALGLTLGIAGGLATANSMRSMLYGVTPLDPLNIIAVISLLTIVTLAASLMPAWRAARVDITDSLRSLGLGASRLVGVAHLRLAPRLAAPAARGDGGLQRTLLQDEARLPPRN